MRRRGVFRVFEQHGQKHVSIKNVNAHGAGDHLRVVRRAQPGLLGLLFKAGDAAIAVDLHHAKVIGLTGIDQDGGQSHVSPSGQVLVQHELVIHLVNVIAGKDDDVLGLLRADGVNILVNRVGGAQVPVFTDALHRRQDLNEFAQLPRHHRTPAFTNVAVE